NDLYSSVARQQQPFLPHRSELKTLFLCLSLHRLSKRLLVAYQIAFRQTSTLLVPLMAKTTIIQLPKSYFNVRNKRFLSLNKMRKRLEYLNCCKSLRVCWRMRIV
ncbi:hypothetical protein L9F63_010515, partial [Diploptera punctata]